MSCLAGLGAGGGQAGAVDVGAVDPQAGVAQQRVGDRQARGDEVGGEVGGAGGGVE
jgi:hypothetical protein